MELETSKDRYFELKTRIRESWFSMAEALREIHSRNLYRVEFDTFDEFCRQTLDISRQRAHQLIGAANVVDAIQEAPGRVLPASEYVARPLAGMEPAAASVVWEMATEETEAPTHDDVRAARKRYEMRQEEESGQDHVPPIDRYREAGTTIVPPPSSPDDRLTPDVVKDLAHFALSGIELDPCADVSNNVDAATAWTEGGLNRDWFGRVFCAPPPSHLSEWVEKAVKEYEGQGEVDAVLMFLPARPWEEWNEKIREYPRCYLRGIPDVQPRSREGFMLVMMGGDPDLFFDNFATEGDCYIYNQ